MTSQAVKHGEKSLVKNRKGMDFSLLKFYFDPFILEGLPSSEYHYKVSNIHVSWRYEEISTGETLNNVILLEDFRSKF